MTCCCLCVHWYNALQHRPRHANTNACLSGNSNNINNSMNTPQQQQQQDELTTTVFGAVEGLSQVRKAGFLLETSLALIESGRYVLCCSVLLCRLFPSPQVFGRCPTVLLHSTVRWVRERWKWDSSSTIHCSAINFRCYFSVVGYAADNINGASLAARHHRDSPSRSPVFPVAVQGHSGSFAGRSAIDAEGVSKLENDSFALLSTTPYRAVED